MEKKKAVCGFDLPIEGLPEHYPEPGELVDAFRCSRDSELEKAYEMISYAAECQCLDAKLELARFLRVAPRVPPEAPSRYEKAEKLLTGVLNLPQVPDEIAAQAAMELAMLYRERMRRPIGALAMMLTAKRYGAKVAKGDIRSLCQRVYRMDVNAFRSAGKDSFRLAMELKDSRDLFRFVEFLLREAGDSAGKDLRGQAYLALAELYEAHGDKSPVYRKEAARCYAMARELGFPEYL